MEDKSIKIGTNIGSCVVSGYATGDVVSKVKDSFNTYTPEQKQSLAKAAARFSNF